MRIAVPLFSQHLEDNRSKDRDQNYNELHDAERLEQLEVHVQHRNIRSSLNKGSI
jgi:hypothetical protein